MFMIWVARRVTRTNLQDGFQMIKFKNAMHARQARNSFACLIALTRIFQEAFSVVRRKHHCRNCGGVFCAKCSSGAIALPKFDLHKNVRVCDMCFTKVSAEVRPRKERLQFFLTFSSFQAAPTTVPRSPRGQSPGPKLEKRRSKSRSRPTE